MRTEVAVVVAGDLARSPRMVNHARELSRAGIPVTLVGYLEREFAPPSGVVVRPVQSRRRAGAFGLASAALRMSLIGFEITLALLRARPRSILVQNPPAFPAMLAAWIAARLCRARLIVDWHNYGYSMLAMQLSEGHPIVRLAAHYEGWLGRRADRHFCVSEAMRLDLAGRFDIHAEVLYDLPPQFFATAAGGERLIAVCPAGWTGDEHMELLLDALTLMTSRGIEFHLTGDGPLRGAFDARIAALRASGIAIQTGFLTEADYWGLIRRSDLGISMHRSSSRLDLAMKVVDLFSAAVPVCALDYGGSLPEQIVDGETGLLFRTAAELAAIFDRVARNSTELSRMRSAIRARWRRTWGDEWARVALPVFRMSRRIDKLAER